MALARPGLGRIAAGRDLLAAELDFARHANVLFVLSALARVHFGRRRDCSGTRGKLGLDAFAEEFCPALFDFGSGLVVV